MTPSATFRFAIDRGGTFTDVYAEVPGEPGFRVVKLLSEDPDHYPDAPVEGIRRVLEDVLQTPLPQGGFDATAVEAVRMGTTIATNALLERKGVRTALVITRGFGDLLQIGKQNRPNLFDLEIQKPEPLYETVIEVDERIRLVPASEAKNNARAVQTASGEWIEVLQEPDWETLKADLHKLKDQDVQSLAVVLMHGYVFPEHEQRIGEIARGLGFHHVSLSSATLPCIKMVDRGQTTCVDAYLTPHIREYLEGFHPVFTKTLAL